MTDDTSTTDTEQCPECGAELKDSIDYIMGHKTADGRYCTECDFEEYW